VVDTNILSQLAREAIFQSHKLPDADTAALSHAKSTQPKPRP
jgi:hypothetical protein